MDRQEHKEKVMKRITIWLGMALLYATILTANTAFAGTKTVYINGHKAPTTQVNELEKAFGVTLVSNAHFTLNYINGDFTQAVDNAYIGNVYEYAFTKLIEKAAIEQMQNTQVATQQNNTSQQASQGTIYNSSINGSFASNGRCSYASAGGYSVKSC